MCNQLAVNTTLRISVARKYRILNWQVTLLLKSSFNAVVDHPLFVPRFWAVWTMKGQQKDWYFIAKLIHYASLNLQPSPYLFTTLCLI